MTCKNPACKYEFCWVCMGAWKDHSGSYYSCNKFDPEKDKVATRARPSVSPSRPHHPPAHTTTHKPQAHTRNTASTEPGTHPGAQQETAEGKKKDMSRAALERYLHYYTRYTNHQKSLKFELAAKEKMDEKIKEMEALGDNTWMDCLYLSEANEALYDCRYALQYTYVYAFFLPTTSNFRHHFEMQQTELERQTEEVCSH